MANNDTIKKTLTVALTLCVVCSVLVSGAAVLLKPMQQANILQDKKRNILSAGGMLQPGVDIDEQFEAITARVVDVETGRFTDAVDPLTFDDRGAARDPEYAVQLSGSEDIAGIRQHSRYMVVYLVTDAAGDIQTLILPISGYGLWSTMYGFVALEPDFNTISGLGFAEHGETPGLGGEIDNPTWQAGWEGKKVFDPNTGELKFTVVKGQVDSDHPEAVYRVDGLSGATLTGRGVQDMIRFWLGDNGFGPFLDNLRNGEA